MSTSHKKEPVFVVPDAAGNVIRKGDKEGWGYVMHQQERLVAENGFADIKTVQSLFHGKIEVLKRYGWEPGVPIIGQVIILERLKPFNAKEPNKHAKIASCGIPCTYQGKQVYRKTEFTFDLKLEDELIEHDNKEEIRLKYLELEEKAKEKKSSESENARIDDLNN